VAIRCSAWAREVALSPIATIGTYAGYLLVETPLPWPRDIGELPALAPVASLLGTAGYRLQALVPPSPNPDPAERRIILHARPSGASDFGGYQRFETRAGRDLEESVRSLMTSVEAGSTEFESPGIDLLICSHGKRDVCCGSKGTELAVRVAQTEARPGIRTWRTSHTGGHRFAPTFVLLPEGTAWAYADTELVASVLDRSVPFARVAGQYRGCAGLTDRRLQALEREVLSLVGWDVLDRARTGSVDGRLARLEIADGQGGTDVWEAQVGPGRTLPVPDCMQPLSAAKKTETELVVTGVHPVP
jgi:hypothetical protein